MTLRNSPGECLVGDAVMHKDILDLYKWAGVEMEAPHYPDAGDTSGSTISFLGVPDFKFAAREFSLGDTTERGWIRES